MFGNVTKEMLDMATEDIKFHRLHIGYPTSERPLMTYKDDVLHIVGLCKSAVERLQKE